MVEGGGARVGGSCLLQKSASLQHRTAFRWAFGDAWWQTIGLPGGTSCLFSKHLHFHIDVTHVDTVVDNFYSYRLNIICLLPLCSMQALDTVLAEHCYLFLVSLPSYCFSLWCKLETSCNTTCQAENNELPVYTKNSLTQNTLCKLNRH